MRVAAIDIGTVTSRLLIADVDASGMHQIERTSRITNLGEGVDASGLLLPEAIERTVKAVADFRRTIDECGRERPVDRIVAVATSASRDAGNAETFVARLREVGIELSVIPGQREAELSFMGAASDFLDEDLLFVDIGGGSTELVCGRAWARAGSLVPEVELSAYASFNIGTRRVTERFLKSDPPTEKELNAAHAWATEVLAPFFECPQAGWARLVGVAGTPTSTVAVRDGLVPYDASKVHGAQVSREEFDQVAHRLLALPLAQRQQVVGLQPKRASVFPGGLIIMDVVMHLAKMDSFTVSESDLLKGIILDTVRDEVENQ